MDREYRSRGSVLLVRMLFCFSIIYRLVFGGDCISPPFFFVKISDIISLYIVIHLFVY